MKPFKCRNIDKTLTKAMRVKSGCNATQLPIKIWLIIKSMQITGCLQYSFSVNSSSCGKPGTVEIEVTRSIFLTMWSNIHMLLNLYLVVDVFINHYRAMDSLAAAFGGFSIFLFYAVGGLCRVYYLLQYKKIIKVLLVFVKIHFQAKFMDNNNSMISVLLSTCKQKAFHALFMGLSCALFMLLIDGTIIYKISFATLCFMNWYPSTGLTLSFGYFFDQIGDELCSQTHNFIFQNGQKAISSLGLFLLQQEHNFHYREHEYEENYFKSVHLLKNYSRIIRYKERIVQLLAPIVLIEIFLSSLLIIQSVYAFIFDFMGKLSNGSCFITFFTFIFCCNYNVEVLKNKVTICKKIIILNVKARESTRLHLQLLEALREAAKVSVYGFIYLGNHLTISIGGFVVTYLIIFLQFGENSVVKRADLGGSYT